MKVSETFTRGLLLGAGFLGVLVLVCGASRALQTRRESREESRLAPNYAYLR